MPDVQRVFLSVDIDDDALLTRILHIQGKLDRQAAKLKIVEPRNIHFTVRFFGDTSSTKIESINDTLRQLEFAPFTIHIDGVGAFPSISKPRVIWVGVVQNADAFIDLKQDVDLLLGQLGYPPDRKFKPHATIARVRAVRNRENVVKNLESIAHESVGTMTVGTIRMTKSTLTPQGPIYKTLWEIPTK
ncbi:MAG: RNA 2',3'-cyclic phosphodiesterase [Candidatus Hodarchaeota archaeon]